MKCEHKYSYLITGLRNDRHGDVVRYRMLTIIEPLPISLQYVLNKACIKCEKVKYELLKGEETQNDL